MGKNDGSDSDSKPVCNIALCGKEADWKVDLFSRSEYYCTRHKPGVPEQFMVRLRTENAQPMPPVT